MIRIVMRGPASWLLFCMGLAAFGAQPELSPEVLLLARIKVHMEENLTRLPNYTCVQTIERSRRRAPSHRFELVDAVRLEVALVGTKELFAWPGAGKFEERELRDFVQDGTIGNGNFALHAYSVFLSSGPTYTYAGERIREGRRTVQFDYRVPYISSGYRITVHPNEARVGYHGSIWVDAETLDLLRLEVHADDIPPRLGISEASDSIEYGRVRIGDSDFLLPQRSELRMVDLAGNESQNRVQFNSCRKFTGESVLSFGEPPVSDAPAAAIESSEVSLPPGLPIELKLKSAIDSEESFVGDPVTAVVAKNVKQHGNVLVPKGATAFGRIVILQRIPGQVPLFRCGVRFYSLEFEGKRAAFIGRLEDAGGLAALRGFHFPTIDTPDSEQSPGLGVLELRAHRFQLPRGYRMRWRTDTTPTMENP